MNFLGVNVRLGHQNHEMVDTAESERKWTELNRLKLKSGKVPKVDDQPIMDGSAKMNGPKSRQRRISETFRAK